jgi:hypothetical protein
VPDGIDAPLTVSVMKISGNNYDHPVAKVNILFNQPGAHISGPDDIRRNSGGGIRRSLEQ